MLGCAATVGEIRKNHSAAGTQVLVGTGLAHGIRHFEIVGDREISACCRNLQKSVTEIFVARKSVAIQAGAEVSIAREQINVPLRISSNTASRCPKCSQASVGNDIQHTRWRER